jgi:hypothetical protein
MDELCEGVEEAQVVELSKSITFVLSSATELTLESHAADTDDEGVALCSL